MYIYNSLTNQKETFRTLEPNKVKMYVCGPTVYNYVHIGNARPVIFFDVVKRYLEHKGYDVTYVSNVTDVDDKIINAAQKEHISEMELSKKYLDAFLDDLRRLHCDPFDQNPKVTEYMDDIIGLIQRLEAEGFAYEVDGDVYFRVGKIEDYGKLSNQETENLEVGARIIDHTKKENPLDFTLWKKTETGIQWDSPWGKGRPGWHTECVAMIHDTLGELIDIHGGGSDLKFPHHENEIAQSEALTQTPLANYWMHNGRLMIHDEKMSKSLGNFIMLKEFLNHFDYRILRLFMLSTHYRQPLNYTDEIIENMKSEWDKILFSYKQLFYKLELNGIDLTKAPQFKQDFIEQFEQAMDDDFNTSNAMSVLIALIKEVNKTIRKGHYTQEDLNEMMQQHHTFKLFLQIFGVGIHVESLDQETIALIHERDRLRGIKEFAQSDVLRAILIEKGINI